MNQYIEYNKPIIKTYLIEFVLFFALFVACVLATRLFIVSPGIVNGPSMEPSYFDEDLFFVNHFAYLVGYPERLDVVEIIQKDEKKKVIKRVIGLPGDVIEIKRGQVYIQKRGEETLELLDEKMYLSVTSYTTVLNQKGVYRVSLGGNQYFVLGDNRAQSLDSRHYGPVSRDRIVGRVIH
ncbi:signal peptidase I [Patescibacteria group bacterium]|nr:signal peptidase I [Patescibacteria group bacterium]MBU1722072.1 signal peptidase I [Patescibacteria group bacterium]MBU1901352.1 signal peptidase I [Patescibacteria group bacterium]